MFTMLVVPSIAGIWQCTIRAWGAPVVPMVLEDVVLVMILSVYVSVYQHGGG